MNAVKGIKSLKAEVNRLQAIINLYESVPPPPTNGTATSGKAAKEISPHVTRMRQDILLSLHEAGPMTAEEMEYATGLGGNTIRPRLGEMEKLHWVFRPGWKRDTKSGREAFVWKTTLLGVMVMIQYEKEHSE